MTGVVVFACGGAQGPAGEAGGRDTSSPPSILLVTLDTTRADEMGFLGAATGATPHLDELAARSMVFSRGYTTAPLTLPAHSSILSGRYPYEHGAHENSRVVRSDVMLLAEQLSARGYRTAAFVSGYPLARAFGLQRGFEVYDDAFPDGRSPAGIGAAVAAGATGGTADSSEGSPVEGLERSAAATTVAAADWLASNAPAVGEPNFLWVHYYDPHEPYDPPPEHARRFPGNPYRAEIAAMDEALGVLLAAVESRAERWLIAVAADHGEGRGDHGEVLHGNLLYDEVMRVPIVLRSDELGAGRNDQPVSVRRLFGTLLGWAGVRDRPAGLLDGEREIVLGEAMTPFLQYGWQPQMMAIDGATKVIRSGERLQVFDLAIDPGERHPGADASLLAPALREALRSYPVPTAAAAEHDSGLGGEERARLAALGYVSWGGAAATRADSPHAIDMVDLFPAFDRASLLFVEGRYGEAAKLFEDLRRRDPGNLMLVLRLAVARSQLGEVAAADDAFVAARALAPDSPDVNLYEALHLARTGRLALAEPLLERVLADRPDRLPALEALARLREAQRRPLEAADLWQRTVDLQPAPGVTLQRIGSLRMSVGDTAGAVAAFERARGELGAAFAGDLELGVLYLTERRHDEARDALDRVLLRQPNHAMALFKRAQVSVLLEEPDRALRIRAARRAADATTAPLIARERLFAGLE